LTAPLISRRRFLAQTLAASLALPATKLFPSSRALPTRRRLRELGIVIGSLPTGKWNAITDVPGVKVGRAQLMINGVPVGKEIQDLQSSEGKKSKSIILIGATNAPMIPAQLQRLCKRMAFGLARTGALSSHGSGDLLLFFSTGVKMKPEAAMTEIEIFNDEWITRAHQAAMEAAEEAILNALCMAETTVGINGNTAQALPIERLPAIMRKYGQTQK